MGGPDIRKSQVVVPTPRDQSFKADNKKIAQTSGPRSASKPPLPNSTSVSSFSEQPPSQKTISMMSRKESKNEFLPAEEDESSFGFKYSFRSKKGFNPTFNKENQDACIVSANLNNRQWEHFFAVCDGHGDFGHVVSGTIRSHFLQVMANSPEFYKKPPESLYYVFRSAV